MHREPGEGELPPVLMIILPDSHICWLCPIIPSWRSYALVMSADVPARFLYRPYRRFRFLYSIIPFAHKLAPFRQPLVWSCFGPHDRLSHTLIYINFTTISFDYPCSFSPPADAAVRSGRPPQRMDRTPRETAQAGDGHPVSGLLCRIMIKKSTAKIAPVSFLRYISRRRLPCRHSGYAMARTHSR